MTVDEHHPCISIPTDAETSQRRFVACLLALLAVFCVRVMLVATYATAAPFWDQWDAEIDHLYLPYLDGSLTIGHWLSAHNEHRIFFTRVVALILFILNDDQFDARVQCFVNVGIFCISLGILLRSISPAVPTRTLALFLFSVVVIFASPLGWENLIAGFQNQFYMLMGFSIMAISRASRCSGKRIDLAVLTLLSACSVFTMASGLLTTVCISFIVVARAFEGALAKRAVLLIVGVQFVVALTAYSGVPHLEYMARLKADSLLEFAHSLGVVLSWPASGRAAYALIFWIPSAVLLIRSARSLTKDRPGMRQCDYIQMGIALWVLTQAVAIAYSRGHDMTGVPSRYSDILAVGLINNIAIALRLVNHDRLRYQTFLRVSTGFFIVFCMTWFCRNLPASIDDIRSRSAGGADEVTLIHSYLMTQDRHALSKLPYPYPDAQRLANELDNDNVADMMPPGARRPLSVQWPKCEAFTRDGTYPGTYVLKHDSVMGSYLAADGDLAEGQCVSAPITRHRRYALFHITGTPDVQSTYLDVIDSLGRSRRLAPSVVAPYWAANLVHITTPTFIMALTDHSPTRWIAASQPVEVGPLSANVERLIARPFILLMMLVALMAAGVSIASLWNPRP